MAGHFINGGKILKNCGKFKNGRKILKVTGIFKNSGKYLKMAGKFSKWWEKKTTNLSEAANTDGIVVWRHDYCLIIENTLPGCQVPEIVI